MNLTQAIERAIGALENRLTSTCDHRDGRWLDADHYDSLTEQIHLDTEALAALREWKPEEKQP